MFPLLVVRSVEERHDLAAGAVVVGAEQAAADALSHAVSCRPGDRVRKVAVGRDVGELRRTRRLGVQGAGEERHRLRAGAGRVGRERAGRRAGGDAVFDGPRHGLLIVAAADHVGHAGRSALRLGRAGGAPQEGHDLRAGAGLLGSEQVIAHAGGDAVLDRPLDGLIEVGVVGHVVEEVQHGVVLHEGRLDLDLAGGHGEGVLAVALVLERQLIAVLVGDGQGLEDVAAVGLDGAGHGVALGGVLGADGHAAVLGLARGRDRVGRVVGAAAAGIIVAPRSGKSNILRNFVGAAHLGAAVIPAVEGVAAALGRGEGDGRAAGHIVCGVSSCTIVILQGKRDLLLSRSLQIGDGIAGLCGSQSIIHTGVVTVGAAIGALDFGTDRISQITGIFQISGEAAAGDAPSSTRSGIQTTGKSTACHGNRASIVAAIKVPVFNCMIRIRVKSATIDRGNMIVLNNGLCNIAERTIVNNQCSIIIILDGVDAAGERAAVVSFGDS